MSEDLVGDAAQELYGLDPSEFTERRQQLAAAARKTGDGVAAKQITALRRPTQAAWVLNRFARAQPDMAGQLADLGAQLRQAQLSLDGAQLRELTQQRRQLIDSLTRGAFAGLKSPAAALLDDVRGTLEAALADTDTASRLAAGRLVQAERWSGFGPSGTELSLVPEAADEPETVPVRSLKAVPPKVDKAKARALAAAQDEFERAQTELAAVQEAGERADEQVEVLTEQLAAARRQQDEARLDVRHAEAQLKRAEQRLRKLQS